MNVMIVDDYPLILQGLKKTFAWEASGFPIVAEANNGQEALSVLETASVDILLTDIRMPVMDGLELIRIVHTRYPQIHIAVLSAFDDFQLVRKAFQLGAKDYLLKQEFDEKAIRCLMEKFSMEKRIESGSSYISENTKLLGKLQQEKEALKDTLTQGIDELREGYFRNVTQRGLHPDAQKEQRLGIRLPQRAAILQFVIETMDSAGDIELIFLSLEHKFRSVVQEQLGGYLFRTNYNEYNLIFPVSEKEPCTDTFCRMYAFVQDYAEQEFHAIVTAGVSEAGSSADLPMLLEQAHRACQSRFAAGKGKLILFSEVEPVTGSSALAANTGEAARQFGQLLRRRNLKEILSSQMLLSDERLSPHEKDVLFTRKVWEIVRLIEEQSLTMSCDKILTEMKFLLTGSSAQERDDWLCDTIKTLFAVSDAQGKYVAQFRSFVEEHYSESNLRAETIAQYLGISVGRMGKILFQETGCHFSDYLNTYRIERAKKLLAETNLKVYEVAEKTGYGNVEHFIRVFKKTVGVNPTAYAHRTLN